MASQTQLQAYEHETRDIIRRLLSGGIGLPECVAALDAALVNLVPDLNPEQLPRIQAVLRANSQAVMEEMEQRAGS
jgi:hypothetical protein